MSFEREEFKAATPRQPRDDRYQLAMIQQAGISAHLMTGDPHWDKFLSYLQAALESNCTQRDAYMNELANPQLVNADEVAKRRIAVMRLNERIDVLQYVMSMPAQLIRVGDAAAVRLKNIPDETQGETQ